MKEKGKMKMGKRGWASLAFLLFTSYFLLGSFLVYAEPLKLTLDEAVETALKANYNVQVAEQNVLKLQATIGEVRSGAFPQITGTASYTRNVKIPQIFINDQRFTLGYNNEYLVGASLNQPLYAAGKVLNAIRAAKAETKSLDASLKDVKHEIELLVKKTFYQVLLADRTITITKKTLDQFTSQLNAIKSRYEKGIDSDYTLMRQEVQVSNVLPELSGAEQMKLVLLNALKDLMALPKETDIELLGDFKFAARELPSEESLLSTALAKRQDIVSKQAHVDMLKYAVKVERGGYLPSLNLTSGINWTAQSNDLAVGKDERVYAADVGFVLSMPIFDGLKTHYRMREAKANLKIASMEEMQLRENVKSEVLNARSAFKEASDREASQKKALALAQKAVDIASLRFSQGLTSQLELNDTILQRDQADKIYAQAVFDALTAEATLKRVIGGVDDVEK